MTLSSTPQLSALAPLYSVDLSVPGARDRVDVEGTELKVKSLGSRLLSSLSSAKPEDKLDRICQCIASNKACFTGAEIGKLTDDQKRLLYQNILALENDWGVAQKSQHLPKEVLKASEQVQRDLFLKDLQNPANQPFFFRKTDKTPPASLDNAIQKIYALDDLDKLNNIKKFIAERYPSLKDILFSIDAKIKFRQIDAEVTPMELNKGDPWKEMRIAGQRCLLATPMHMARDNPALMGDAWKAFLQKALDQQCDLIINLALLDEPFTADPTGTKTEVNYLRNLKPALATNQSVDTIWGPARDERINTQGFFTQPYSYVAPDGRTLPVLHMDGFSEQKIFDPKTRLAFIRNVRNCVKNADQIAKDKGVPVSEVKVLAHCRQGLNRTPFFVALFCLMSHPEWIRGKSDQEIADKLMGLIGELAKTERHPTAVPNRLPTNEMIMQFFTPEVFQYMREMTREPEPTASASSLTAAAAAAAANPNNTPKL